MILNEWFLLNKTNQTRETDFPLPLAIFLLLAVLFVLYGWSFSDESTVQWKEIDRALEAHWPAVTCFFACLCLNLSWLALLINRVVGLKKQGSRLSRLVKNGRTGSVWFRKHWKRYMVLAAGIAVAAFLASRTYLGAFSEWLSDFLDVEIGAVIHGNGVITALIAGSVLGRAASTLARKREEHFGLPPFPVEKNCIVIGAVGEEI